MAAILSGGECPMHGGNGGMHHDHAPPPPNAQ
jgi:hypothetical protein